MNTQTTRILRPKFKGFWRGLIAKAHEWGYRQGVVPDQWHTLFPSCSGKNQSPIDIKTDKVVYDPDLENFNLKELETVRDVKMVLGTNHGRSVQVDLKGQDVKVTGGRLPGTYIVEQFHFHWGPDSHTGSEHTLDGKQFSSEMHIVMHSDKYKNSGEALHKTNGLAVLGYFIDIGPHNKSYDTITDSLKSIKKSDDSIILPSFCLTSLLPSSDCYYRYHGSQTTPPCASVIWTMFKERIFLSEVQLKKFRSFGDTSSADMDLIHNCRKPQPIDDRIVTTNCPAD